jgi:hypothetical protein
MLDQEISLFGKQLFFEPQHRPLFASVELLQKCHHFRSAFISLCVQSCGDSRLTRQPATSHLSHHESPASEPPAPDSPDSPGNSSHWSLAKLDTPIGAIG